MSAQANKEIVLRAFDEVWNKGNLAIMDQLMTPDYAFHDPGFPDANIEQDKQSITVVRAAFPDGHATVQDAVAEGDRVAVRWTYSGTHKGELRSIPPTGKRITLTGIAIYRLAEGKIAEVWSITDRIGFLQQLGVISPLG